MIKATFAAVVTLIVIHAIALAGFVGWLEASGRLDRERYDKVVEIFELTIEEQKAKEEEAIAQAKVEGDQKKEAMRLKNAAQGASSFDQKLVDDESSNELMLEQYARLKRDIADIQRRIASDKLYLRRQKEALDAARQDFEEYKQQFASRNEDEDFTKTVQMLSQLSPKQGKQILISMMQEGRLPEAVEYLVAMSSRKSGSIMREFKLPSEIQQAKLLLDQMRIRGAGPMADASKKGQFGI